MKAYYNEIDPKAAAWLRELVSAGLIADGDVDERSIEDVLPADLAGYTQCHFFAGIGGWSYALRLAGIPDTTRVWTGSCPCQPFSAAGKGKGFADERHLWPAWFHLIRECRPERIFGEQVAGALGWLDLVSTDLEAEGYAVGAAIVGAHSVGAPHVRQRLYWLADASRERQQQHAQRDGEALRGAEAPRRHNADGCGELGNPHDARSQRRSEPRDSTDERAVGSSSVDGGELGHAAQQPQWPYDGEPRASREQQKSIGRSGISERMEHAESDGREQRRPESGEWSALGGCGESIVAHANGRNTSAQREQRSRQHGLIASHSWACDWISCSDGKSRPVEPGTFPLAHGIPGRVGLLRGYGNAIVPQDAAEFIMAHRW